MYPLEQRRSFACAKLCTGEGPTIAGSFARHGKQSGGTCHDNMATHRQQTSCIGKQ